MNPEVSEYLVGSAAFKAVGTGDPRAAGSIPVHLRHTTAPPPHRAGPSVRPGRDRQDQRVQSRVSASQETTTSSPAPTVTTVRVIMEPPSSATCSTNSS